MRRKISLQSTMKVDFDMIFRLDAAQKLVAEHCVSDFRHDFSFKGGSTLGCRALYERNFDMIFHFMAAQKLFEEHYERDFYMIFHINEAQHLFAEHSERF